jgi:tetratricopeptide (TPR) repeat protein
MRTLILSALFAAAASAANSHYETAQRMIAEAQGTSHVVRMLVLAWKIEEELTATLRLDPDHVDARLDLVRYHVMTPRITGGRMDEAKRHAAELAKRDAALGHFANGYIAYRQKQYGTGRRELREAIKTATKSSTRILALRWLGWLSQESQQYDEAFWAFEKILSIDPMQLSASYEIGRTSVFCRCRTERGEEALTRFLLANPRSEEAAELLSQLR